MNNFNYKNFLISTILSILHYNQIKFKMANCPEFYSREITILQQSQSKLALDFLTNYGIIPTAKELWQVTEVFVQCCLHKQDDDLKKRIKDLDKWIEERKMK